ncbi:MAG: hypothetical protein AB7P03_18765 [Kofleriaceae bacterium]
MRAAIIAGHVLGWALAISSTGCSRTFSGSATQPNPLVLPTETLRKSETITIVRGDMDLESPEPPSGPTASLAHNHRYPLLNAASFTVVSRDRLRFHVQIDHKWQDWADLTSWDVSLQDDQGRRWDPDSIEHANTRIITTMWDREQRTAMCSSTGRDARGNCYTTVGYYDDGWRRRQTLGSLSVFRGKADFVFHEPDLFNPQIRQLRLVVKRPGEAFEFTWRFQDRVASY